MSVNALYCEGVAGSPDIRILRKLLNNVGQIAADHSKFGIEQRILTRREKVPSSYCVIDGDFRPQWTPPPSDSPEDWTFNQRGQSILIGWKWQRKEMENYLLDPEVIKRALEKKRHSSYQKLLENNATSYYEMLDQAANEIANYQAARITLSSFQLGQKRLLTKFGEARGKHNYLFPTVLNDQACQDALRDEVNIYQQHHQQISEDSVLNRYAALKQECNIGGVRRQHFLYTFAGKDLLWALHEHLMQNGIGGGGPAFLESIVKEIQNGTDDIATWLPEWQALCDKVNAVE